MTSRFQTLGAAAFALIAVTVSTAAIYDSYATGDRILFPPMPSESILTGQVSGSIPVNEFTSEQVANGVVLPKDSHNFFTCKIGGGVSTTANDLANTRAWIYEFTGNEPPFNGDFFISSGELAVNPQYDNLNTLSQLSEGKRYYQMGEIDLYFQCGKGLSFTESCGDNSCQVTESAQSCPQDCNVCGDGVVYGAEECDDNNGLDNDGCDVFCEVEVGYSCEAEPSQCSLLIPQLPGGGGTNTVDASVLNITIDGPAQSDHSPAQQNLNLGNISFETGDANANIDYFFIAIQGTASDSEARIHNIMNNVHLKNTVSSEEIAATRLLGSVDYGETFGSEEGIFQIYRFNNMEL